MKTKIIAVGNQKGGVGKSATVYWLASTLSKYYDKKVAVYDGIDHQKSIAKMRSREISEGKIEFPYELFYCEKVQDVDALVELHDGKFDIIFLDMPPLVEEIHKNILGICDGLLIPMFADVVDLDSSLDYMLYVEVLKQMTASFECYAFINRFRNSVRQKMIPAFCEQNGIELFESSIKDVPLVFAMDETFTSPYEKKGSTGISGREYLEDFVNEFIHKFLAD